MGVNLEDRETSSTVRVETGRYSVAVRRAGPRGEGAPVVLVHGMAVASSHVVPTLTRSPDDLARVILDIGPATAPTTRPALPGAAPADDNPPTSTDGPRPSPGSGA